MPASLHSIRNRLRIKPTAQNKGLTLTVSVTAYDNGLITVDGRPMTGVESGGYLQALVHIGEKIEQLRHQAEARAATLSQHAEAARTMIVRAASRAVSLSLWTRRARSQ